MTLAEVINVLEAFSQNGIVRAAFSGIGRALRRYSWSGLIKAQLRHSIVVRSVPKNWKRLLFRCKLTVTLTLANVAIYFGTTDSSGHLFPWIESKWGYTWSSFIHSPSHALLLSPFLHWNLLHLNFNMISLIFFTGGLEYLAGTSITAICYFVPMILSNPLTSLLVIPTGLTTPTELDVGASLGIFGCGGTLSYYFLKQRWMLAGPLCIVTLLQSWDSQHWIIMNHWSAVFLGILAGRILLKT